MLALADRFPTSRPGALGALVVGAPAGLAVFGLLTRVLGGRSLRSLAQWAG